MHLLNGYDWFDVACLETYYHDYENEYFKDHDKSEQLNCNKKTISPDRVLYKFDTGILYDNNGDLEYLPLYRVNLLDQKDHLKNVYRKLRHKFHNRRLKEKIDLDKDDILYEGGDGVLIEIDDKYCFISKSDVNWK